MQRRGRKDVICVSCELPGLNFGFGMCSACLRKFKRRTRPSFYLGTCYSEIRRRCGPTKHNSSKRYIGLPFCTREEFINRFLTDRTFLRLFIEWQLSGYKKVMAPSIDRIDSSKGYLIENLQFLTQSENSKKDQKKTPIKVYDKNSGRLLGEFTSIGEAAKSLCTNTGTLWRLLRGSTSSSEFIVRAK